MIAENPGEGQFAPSRRLVGRTAVVTGGNKGIGRAICIDLAREGADVAVVAGRDLAGAQETAREVERYGGRSLALLVDVTSKSSVDAMVALAAEGLGRLDILVNNAGGGGMGGPLEDLAVEDWDRAFALNARGTFLCSAACVPQMARQGRGSIITMAGASAHRCYPQYGAFGPSKAAVVSFTIQASIEWARHGIRVNGVSPGPIRDYEGWQEREPAVAREVQLLPLKRAGTRQEVARTVTYLASDDAAYTTGQMLIVDGGGVNTWYLCSATRHGRTDIAWD